MTLRRASRFWGVKGGGAVGPTFDPNSLPGIYIWYDVNDFSTLTIDGSGNVEQINDKAPNSRHASNSDSTKRPLYEPTGLNGMPTMKFDGINDILSSPVFLFSLVFPVYLYIVFEKGANNSTPVSVYRTGTNSTYITVLQNSTGPIDLQGSIRAGTAPTDLNRATLPNAKTIVLLERISNNFSMVDEVGSQSTTYIGLVNANIVLLGQLRTTSPISYFDGRISEVIFYSGTTHSTSEKNQVLQYLADKYSLTQPVAV